jgi:hypothetical protein
LCSEERLALVLQNVQSTDDFLHAEVVMPTDTRREGIESRQLSVAHARLFCLRSQSQGSIERRVGGAGAVEFEELCDPGKRPALVP